MMAAAHSKKVGPSGRGVLARPLDTLVFLLPLILFYEVVSAFRPSRVIAFDLMHQFFSLFGYAGTWGPPLTVIVILLATQIASGQAWRVHWRQVGLMYVEATALALPLFAINWAMPLPPIAGGKVPAWLGTVAVGIGAGVYEELVFRLVLISLLVMIGVDLLKQNPTLVTAMAIALSSLAFAAHHHPPLGSEPFNPASFAFRTVAGGYLAIIFWYRGYGPAAGCHAAYNVALTCLG